MVLSNQPTIPWWQTSFDNGESEAVGEAIKAKKISQGDVTKTFETALSEFLEVDHVIATNSGTSAITLALMGIGIKPGDEVLVPNRTWIATAHAVHILGAVPIFVDSEPGIPIMSTGNLQQHLTSLTKAIIPVHVNGREADMDEINGFARAHGLLVIEDAAQAIGSKGATGKFVGTNSSAGCFSLSVAKLIATGQGGFIATNDSKLANRFRNLRTHGVENTIAPGAWDQPGFNFRFTDILATIGILQLGLLPKRIKRIKEIEARYKSGLRGILSVDYIDTKVNEVGPYIEVLANERDRLRSFLSSQAVSIETRPFYPNLNTAHYWKLRNTVHLPNSIKFQQNGLYLPSGPSILDSEIDYVLSALQNFS